jgi:hypothetical protein
MPKINCCADCEVHFKDSAKCYDSINGTFQFNKCSKSFHFIEDLVIFHNNPCKGKCDHSIICNNFKRRK